MRGVQAYPGAMMIDIFKYFGSLNFKIPHPLLFRVWLMCEPASRSREPRVASLFLRATAFFLFIYLFFYLFIYLFFGRFKFNVNVVLSKWCTWQKKHKFSIFFRAWNSAQVVAVICWRSVYSFRYEWNFELPSQVFVWKCWLCKID